MYQNDEFCRKAQLYEGGMRVPGFVHSPFLPEAAHATVSEKLFHVSDWLDERFRLA